MGTTLEDRYLLEEGRVLLTGVQALVRLPLDQHRADRRRDLLTGTMVSGYPGSPLGGLDSELERNRQLCERHHIHHVPGLNEELGATAAWGSQLAVNLPGMRYDGVLAMWYGKAPGLDRATDALRHGNFAGVGRTGGALAVVGDDPSSKSSPLPSASESLLANLHMPVFFPGSVQEVLDLGLHALACSRAAGLWCSMKMVTDVAEAVETVAVSPGRVAPSMPLVEWRGKPYVHVPDATLLAPSSLAMEQTLVGPRTELALAYARENGINRVEGARGEAWLGIVAAGKSYYDLQHALRELGLGAEELKHHGVRILKLGMIWPLETDAVRAFANGVEEVLVVEEKRPFVEAQVKDALYGTSDAPRIVGKRAERGRALLAAEGDLDVDAVARALAERLLRRVRIPSVEARVARLDAIAGRAAQGPVALGLAPRRMPFFCSGCPHNSSMKAPHDTLVGAGVGCHTLVLLNPRGAGDLAGLTQMGGEGAQWIGMAPFTDDAHFVQNLGDGTFHHSGSLALRAAVAAGVNITYKLLYNQAVAMTGGQHVAGAMAVPELTRALEAEGVRRVVVTTEDPARYRGVRLASIAEVRDRAELVAAQQELAEIEGVTVLIHDQECAIEKRRRRKRGKETAPATRVWINERVCEGCGDCGRKSNCLSVQTTETEFGPKARIDQASCNEDYSCLTGDCPSLLTVVPGKRGNERSRSVPRPPGDLPEPNRPAAGEWGVRMVGIGGTGVVTVNRTLATAATIDGLHVLGLDQTGLSQKAGPVVSDLRISRTALPGASRMPAGGVDLYLGLDLLTASDPTNLAACDPERAAAVVSTSAIPTGSMVAAADVRLPEAAAQLEPISAVTRTDRGYQLDTLGLAKALFDDTMPANTIALGAAYQCGLLPVSAGALREAFRISGPGAETSLRAFDWGRACVAAPEAVDAATSGSGTLPERTASDEERRLAELALGTPGETSPELWQLVQTRIGELADYQSIRYARRYAERLQAVRERERERVGGAALTEAVARNLHKLMAYKDEYEVARLHLDAAERARLDDELGADAKVLYNFQPPLLRALGLRRKLELGSWFTPLLRGLRALRRLRGTALDPFARNRVRRVERALIPEYEALVAECLAELEPSNAAVVLELCELPDVVRGYEQIKLDNVTLFRERASALRGRL